MEKHVLVDDRPINTMSEDDLTTKNLKRRTPVSRSDVLLYQKELSKR